MTQTARGPGGDSAPIQYEPGLVEASVRRGIECGTLDIHSLKLQRLRLEHRRKLEVIYGEPDGTQREAAFRDHFTTLFAELGMASWIPRWLDHFPVLRAELECVVVRSASAPGDGGAELWENQERRGEGIPAYLVITVAGAGFENHDELAAVLLPDLMRAADLLDPDFGFRPADLRADTRGAEERIRGAYQRLWELSARVRLRAQGLRDDDRLLADAARLVAGAIQDSERTDPNPSRDPAELLTALGHDISHRRLVDLAVALGAGAGVVASATVTRCPLCHYPTTDWSPTAELRAVESEVRADFPAWSVKEGCCGHCAERYALLASTADTTS